MIVGVAKAPFSVERAETVWWNRCTLRVWLPRATHCVIVRGRTIRERIVGGAS